MDATTRAQFEKWTATGQPNLRDAPALGYGALMAHAAFVRPERTVAIFDALAHATAASADPATRADWLEAALPFTMSESTADPAGRSVPAALWDAFWAVTGTAPGSSGSIDPLAFTITVVAMGIHYDQTLIDRCEATLMAFDNVRRLLAEPEVRMRTADLAGKPADSLGTELLTMLTANGYDLEVIDPDAVVLPGAYPAQNRTNRRILQLHDVWHLVGGYGFTGAGEIAISGFQLAQFGQNYSTRFLATVQTMAVLHMEPMAETILTVILDGWRHGRETPDLLAVPWHHKLDRPIRALRDELGVTPFDSPVARIMEAAK